MMIDGIEVIDAEYHESLDRKSIAHDDHTQAFDWDCLSTYVRGAFDTTEKLSAHQL